MKRQIFNFTTSSGGAATVGAGQTTAQPAVLGKLYAIEYLPGDIDTGATITVTCEGQSSKPLLTKANAGTSNVFFYPRDLMNAVADGAALTGTAGGDRALPLLAGQLKVVIASGGDTKTGKLVVYYEE